MLRTACCVSAAGDRRLRRRHPLRNLVSGIRQSRSAHRPRLHHDLARRRARAAPRNRPRGRPLLRARFRKAGARPSRRDRRHRSRHAGRKHRADSARRLLRPGLPQHLFGVQARRWPHGLDARRSMGRPALEPLARQPLQHAEKDHPRRLQRLQDPARVRPGHPRHRDAEGHRFRQALPHAKPHADQVLGPPDLLRRHRAAAARLREDQHFLSGALRARPLLHRRAAAIRAE